MFPRRRTYIPFCLTVGCFFVLIYLKMQKNLEDQNHQSNQSDNQIGNNAVNDLWNKDEREITSSVSLKEIIKFLNDEQKIYNSKLFGPVNNETILITIQVHNRTEYLRHLILSLSAAKDINKVLIIFSHDIYNTSINQLVREINFCMFMQIFYPYSIQLYPNEFPGTNQRDCERDVGRAIAARTDCLNARDDDTYGHYREAKFTQMKHHWWWKLNRIFDELRVTRHRNGMLILLEEDYYVAADFLHTFELMREKVPKLCPQCNLFSLGTYNDHITKLSSNIVDMSPWITSKHNMGMAFNKSTWLEVRKCGAFFCNYDEYNYDFSLQNVNRKCLKNHFYIALIRGPRVFHVGECGVHHAKTNCDVNEKINEINSQLERAWRDNLLYPLDINMGSVDRSNPSSTLINNGGWADKRDHCLCNSMINANERDGVDLQKCRNIYKAKP